MQGKKLITGVQRLIYLNNCIINSHNVWTNIMYYVSVLIINFISTTYGMYVYFILFLGEFCQG